MNENEGLGALTAKLAEAISENVEDQKSTSDQEIALTQDLPKKEKISSRLDGTPLILGTAVLLGLLYTNMYFFEPYFTSILFAWAVSLPLRPVKDTIVSFLKDGLKNQQESLSWDFVSYNLSRVLFGEKVSTGFFELLSPFLYPGLKLSDSTPSLKLRPVEEKPKVDSISTQPPSSPKPGSNNTDNIVEKDVFRELSKDSTTMAKKPSQKSNAVQKASLDPLFAYLQRADWYYLILAIRSCTAYSLGKYFLIHKTKLILVLALIYGGSTISSKSDGGLSPAFSKVKGVFSLIHNLMSKLKQKLSQWVLASVDSAVVTMLMISIVGGIFYGSYTFYNSLICEIKGGLKYYLIGLIEFLLAQVTGVIKAIALNSNNAPQHISVAQEYIDGFLVNQLQLNTTATEVANYVSTSDFAEWMTLKAPNTWGFMQGSVEKGLESLTDSTFLTTMIQEIQSVVQSEFSSLGSSSSIDVSAYAPLVALPVFGAISKLASGLIQGFLVPVMLGFFDSIFQVVVFAVVLSGLLAQKESPLEPARRLLCKVWGEEAANFESRLANRIEEQISGICLFTVQMGVFHFLFTWLSLHLTNAPGPCIFALLSGIIAVIPIGGPYIGALPPVMIMWHGERRYVASLILFISQVAAALIVDSNFYSHLPTVSSFFIALAAFLGHAVLGLKGILVGPLVLSMVPVLYSEFLVDANEKLIEEISV